MHLTDADLEQLNAERVSKLTPAEKECLLLRTLEDLKEARERLNAHSGNSSRPPSSDPPWGPGVDRCSGDEKENNPEPSELGNGGGKSSQSLIAVGESGENEHKRAGRRPGAAGHSRECVLPATEIVEHLPSNCVVCGNPLDGLRFRPETGLYVLELERTEQTGGLSGLQLRHDKHLYGTVECWCGHPNRSIPGRCADEPLWTVALNEWCLVGPMLSSFLVCLACRMRLSRRLIRELMEDWFGVRISTSLINRCIHEAGRAVEPLEEQLAEEVRKAVLAHADETPWKEWGRLLWMWVIATPTVTWYLIGHRNAELLEVIFEKGFSGWLMSDGYAVYRRFKTRLRCWAHLMRKAIFLTTCLDRQAQQFGEAARELLEQLMAAVYQAREGPPVDLTPTYSGKLEAFRTLCENYRDADHKATRALAREFLLDWEAIFRVLEYPWLPLTNNEAERALRHWVIFRRITQGTRTEQGSRALTLLASIIETCRKRNVLPWPFLANVIAERRKGLPAPPIPAPLPAA